MRKRQGNADAPGGVAQRIATGANRPGDGRAEPRARVPPFDRQGAARLTVLECGGSTPLWIADAPKPKIQASKAVSSHRTPKESNSWGLIMPIWTIAWKEARLLLRDPRSGIILLAMPFLFIVVLSLALGEGFGDKPDNRLRVSVLDLDDGFTDPSLAARELAARFAWLPVSGPARGGV